MAERAFWRWGFYTCGVLLAAAPAFLFAGAALSASSPARWLALPAFALALAWAVRALKGKFRTAAIFPGVLLSFFAALALGQDIGWTACLMGVLSAAAFAAHLLFLSRLTEEGPAPETGYFAFLLYLFTHLLTYIVPLPAPRRALTVCAACYLCWLALALGWQSLLQGTGGGKRPSRQMVVRNLPLIGVFVLAFLFLTHLPQVMNALRAAVRAVLSAVMWLLTRPILPNDESGGGGGSSGGGMPGMEPAEASVFWRVLEQILRALVAVGLAVLLFFLLRFLLKRLRRAAARLLAYLRTYAGAVSGAYEDTVERLKEPGGRTQRISRERKKAAARVDRTPYDRLSPRQQVRRSYRERLSRHPELPLHRTARQDLKDQRLSGIYEKARYGSGEISRAEAEEFRPVAKETHRPGGKP